MAWVGAACMCTVTSYCDGKQSSQCSGVMPAALCAQQQLPCCRPHTACSPGVLLAVDMLRKTMFA